jgi:cytidine deaminase
VSDAIARGEAIARIAALSAAGAVATGATAQADDDLTSLLAQLRPVDGVISAERVRASGIPKPVLMNRLRPWATRYADPPISHFFVGAVMEGVSGALYAGSNFEFPSESLIFTVHGEGAATTNAWLHDETGIVSLAVGGVPCGYCRQFLSEFVATEKLTIYLPDNSAVTLASQMPNAFVPSVLGVTTSPFAQRHTFTLRERIADPLRDAALAAANRSHAPYSTTYAGVALELHDGTIVSGRYAENVAFNPGMLPLEAALIALRLRGRGYAEIGRAVLVESAGRISLRTATQAVLATIGTAPLIYARAV